MVFAHTSLFAAGLFAHFLVNMSRFLCVLYKCCHHNTQTASDNLQNFVASRNIFVKTYQLFFHFFVNCLNNSPFQISIQDLQQLLHGKKLRFLPAKDHVQHKRKGLLYHHGVLGGQLFQIDIIEPADPGDKFLFVFFGKFRISLFIQKDS